MPAGTGTAGANQNGAHPTGPAHTPGEILSAAGPLSINASAPIVNTDFGDMFANSVAYDLRVRDQLVPNLILDQFADHAASEVTHNQATKRIFFMDDLPAATTPLLENLDVDSTPLTGRSVDLTQREYGMAVTRTRLLIGQSAIPFDPKAARKVAYNAAKTLDVLARTALSATSLALRGPSGGAITGTIGTLAPTLSNGSPGYISTDVLQEATVMLADQNVDPIDGEVIGDGMGQYVLITAPRGNQHLRAEAGNAGWREVVMRNEGKGGNSILRGDVGDYEGVRVVVSRNLTPGTSFVIGAEALGKVYPNVEGFGAYPEVVLSPVVDKLRRFAGVGWRWLGGYSIIRPQAVIRITHTANARPLGAVNSAIGATIYAES